MVLFKDLNKASGDLLRKGFPYEKLWEVEYKYKNKNPAITNVAGINEGGVFDASTTAKYVVAGCSTELKLLNSGRAHIDFQYKVDQAPGLTFGVKYERKGEKISDSADLSMEWNKGCIHSNLMVNPLLRSFNTSHVYTYNAFRFGGEVGSKFDLSNLKYSIGLAHTSQAASSQWTASLKASPAGSLIFGKFDCNIHGITREGNGAEISAEASYSIPDTRASITFGGLWYLNGEKDTYVKARMNNNAQLSMALTHRLGDALSATVGTQVDVLKAQSPENLKYGLKFDVCS